MASTAEHTDPKLWESVKEKVTKGSKGGKPGQWSARKAQMATAEYEKEGGGFKGEKRKDNSLRQWQDEDWGTKSGEKSADTGERYLPRKAREALSDEDYKKTSDKKRADARKGRQHSAQPAKVAEKTAKYRDGGAGSEAKAKRAGGAKAGGDAPTKADLYAEARKRDIPNRSKMTKGELEKALAK